MGDTAQRPRGESVTSASSGFDSDDGATYPVTDQDTGKIVRIPLEQMKQMMCSGGVGKLSVSPPSSPRGKMDEADCAGLSPRGNVEELERKGSEAEMDQSIEELAASVPVPASPPGSPVLSMQVVQHESKAGGSLGGIPGGPVRALHSLHPTKSSEIVDDDDDNDDAVDGNAGEAVVSAAATDDAPGAERMAELEAAANVPLPQSPPGSPGRSKQGGPDLEEELKARLETAAAVPLPASPPGSPRAGSPTPTVDSVGATEEEPKGKPRRTSKVGRNMLRMITSPLTRSRASSSPGPSSPKSPSSPRSPWSPRRSSKSAAPKAGLGMVRAGVMLLRSVARRRDLVRKMRAFDRLQSALLFDSETERYAEQMTERNAEVDSLFQENMRLRAENEREHERALDMQRKLEENQSAAGSGAAAAGAEAAAPSAAPASAGAAFSREQVEEMLKKRGIDPATVLGPAGGATPAEVSLKDDPDYGPFFKMLAVKVPKQAVINKMEAKGLDPKYLDMDPNSPSPNQPAKEAAADSSSGTAPAEVSLKDDPDYGPFFKMLAVKVPKQAVINKMEAKGLDPKYLDMDPNSPSPNQPAKEAAPDSSSGATPAEVSLKDDPDYGPFFKMLAVKVPKQAVINKMEAKGLDPKYLDMDPNSPSPNQPAKEAAADSSSGTAPAEVSLKDDPDYGPFFKMLAVKVPKQAVINKMEAKGLDPKYLDMDPNSPSPNQPAKEAAPDSSSGGAAGGVKLKDDPEYGPFFKMLAVKVPRGAVEAKMRAKGLDPEMLDKDPNSLAPVKEAPADAESGKAAGDQIKLKEHPDFAAFFKMLAVKVPRGAVEAKMRAKGLDPEVLNKDPESMVPAPGSESGGGDGGAKQQEMVKLKEHPDYAPFFKMLAVKVPRGAVEAKMRAKNLDPAVLDKDPESMVPAPGGEGGAKQEMVKLKEHPDYAPFFKMLAVKVPRGAVEAKMRAKNLDPAVLDKDPESMVPAPGGGGGSAGKTVKLKEHPDYAPFFKMLAVKVPRGAVEAKMRAKNLDPAVLDKDPESMVPAPGGGGGDGGGGKKKVEAAKKPEKPKEPVKKPDKIVRRKLHWRKLTERSLEGADKALWVRCKPFVFEQRELKELTQFFTFNMSEEERRKAKEKAAKAAEEGDTGDGKGGSGAGGAKKKAKEEKMRLLDPQRSNNLSIVLTRMRGKGVDSRTVRRCLFELDIPEEVNLEDVRSLLAHLPTPEEEKVLRAYEGERSKLAAPEVHFLELMDIPRFKQKVKCFMYKMKFDEAFEDVSIDLQVLLKACRAVLDSNKLQRLLEIVLALGNFMNEGPDAPRGRLAAGFSLDALLKLRTVRSFVQKETTALHYLVMLIQSRERSILTYVKSDTDDIRSAATVSLTNALAQLQTLSNEIKALEVEHKYCAEVVGDEAKREKMTPEDQKFVLALNKFYTLADASLKELQGTAEKTEQAFKDVLDYFCEDAATTSEQLFHNLQAFFADFELALNENDAARQKFLKRQRARFERAAKEQEAAAKKAGKGAGGAGGSSRKPGANTKLKRSASGRAPAKSSGKATTAAGKPAKAKPGLKPAASMRQPPGSPLRTSSKSPLGEDPWK